MTIADWRSLIEAYLDGRLSAEAFTRRFIEAWTKGRHAAPPAIAALYTHVEAYESQVLESEEEGVVNDDEVREAAQRAFLNLGEDAAAVSAHTFDRTRAREDMRRFQVQMRGCAGLGCVIALIWVALCILQINFVIEWIHSNVIDNVWLAAVIGFFLAFVPVVGNILAFLGATAAGWPTWLAAIVFFAAPAVTILSGWSRYRQSGPPRG